MSPVQRRPDGLGDFLKARRAQLTPHEVGLPEAGAHRKVAGLRREEVAQLAAISVDYLTRLEQGRVHASASVLLTLSRVLRLDDDQRAYLYQRLMVLTAEAGTPSYERLCILASWNAELACGEPAPSVPGEAL